MEAAGREWQDEIILEREWKEKRVKKGTLGDTDTSMSVRRREAWNEVVEEQAET